MTQSGNALGLETRADADRARLKNALILTCAFTAVELLAGLWLHSLALIGDAAHMFTDACAIAIAMAALRVGRRPADDARALGSRRFVVLAAGFNAVLLFGIALFILLEGLLRLMSPPAVNAGGMMVVGALGVLVNLICASLLRRGAGVGGRAMVVAALTDMLGALGVLIGGGLIWLTGRTWIDPLIAIAIGLWVMPRTWTLLKEATHVLLNSVPTAFTIDDVRLALMELKGVNAVRDLHLWSTDSGETQATVQVVLAEQASFETVRDAAARVLRDFGVRQVTLELESRTHRFTLLRA